MSIVAWIALGLVGGTVAGWLWGLRGRALLSDAVVGVIGAVLGGFMAAVLLGLDIADFDGTSVLVAAIGAGLLILVVNTLPAIDIYE
ncbi:MAG: GlsB/YeaQ/YmgE family stress response membrane protein [Chloroflexi bacterium]|nr:MAG: GlsB/YeaQ/YmgE family stress response membrane protein [Chloroflexota bacterium]TMF03821.1 MAG: GlsB/YeaQ/YmgE family stress response membrane protein [Chloroflexota bacterium]